MLTSTAILYVEQTIDGCTERHYSAFDSVKKAIRQREVDVILLQKTLKNAKTTSYSNMQSTGIKVEAGNVSVRFEVAVVEIQDRVLDF